MLVKDEIDTAGMPTTLGTLVFKDYRPPRDAFVVEKLRKAGAIILGKTTLSEFAAGDTYGSMFGVTRNPYDLERTVGGSSGGSGAALAANFSTVALGEETLASIRRPGAWNAVVALRPTPGLVSRSGMWDGYPTPVAQMGPMARTVSDLAKLLDGMVGYDPEDPVTRIRRRQDRWELHAVPGPERPQGRAHRHPARDRSGPASEPNSDDFKNVDAAFEKNVAELKSGRRHHRRSDRDPEAQEACWPRGRAIPSRPIDAPAALSRAQSGLAVQDPSGHRQFARYRQELSAHQGRASGQCRPRHWTMPSISRSSRPGKN